MRNVRLLLLIGHIIYCCEGQGAESLYDPSTDAVIDTTNDDSVRMIGGHPDMRSVFDIMQRHEQFEAERNDGYSNFGQSTDILQNDSSTLNSPIYRRRKRFVLDDPKKQWTNGIIPYQFHPALPQSYKTHYLNYVFRKVEYWTYFRFVPWNASVPVLYNLTHQNYLIFVKAGYSCWSYVGNNRAFGGQRISCCRYNRCMHELGHAIGLYHEQSNPLRDDYIRINFENIKSGAVRNFKKGPPFRTRSFGYYDASSVMAYGGTKVFSKNGFDTVTTLDDEALHLEEIVDHTYFYMFYETQTVYRMKETKCSEFSMNCVNDGYVSYINNTCRCRCTTGMDHRTGCATPIGTDIWPGGSFAVVKVNSVCPPGFQHDIVTFQRDAPDQSIDVCTKMYQQEPIVTYPWSPGTYCVLSAYSTPCPQGFQLQYSLTNCTLCCRKDGHSSEPVTLPLHTPFILLTRIEYGCQQVKGAVGSDVYSPVLNVLGMKGCQYSLSFAPSQSTCGNTVYLGETNQQSTVMSPGYPLDYTDAASCTWFFKGPPGSVLKLEFTVFEIHTDDELNRNGHMEIRHVLTGQPGVKYCGRGFKRTIISNSNRLQMILSGTETIRHRQQATGMRLQKRFNATVTLIRERDMCYTNGGRDGSYNGNINYTRNFQTCLPWDEITKCRHHTFSDSTIDLEANYCRNPGHGNQPWCYTDADTCDRAYCDACQLRRCFDIFDDCHDMIQNDKHFCERDPEASRGCRRSCEMCNTDKPKTVSTVRCPPPVSHPPDGQIVTEVKESFVVGEKIGYRCIYTTESSTEQRYSWCTSEGTWTFLGKVCQGGGRLCLDERRDCVTLLHRTPTMCRVYREFAMQKCAKTCGICIKSNRFAIQDACSIVEEPLNATARIKSNRTLVQGDVVEYVCHEGFVLKSGNLERACQANGRLTGQRPVCLAKSATVTELFHVPLRRRSKVGSRNQIHTFSNAMYRINRTGEILSWKFYSLYSGHVQFQVWRQYRNTKWFKLVGVNDIEDTRNDRVVSVDVTVEHRIQVKDTDIIAIYFPNETPGGVTFDPCNPHYNPEGVSTWVPVQPQTHWTPGRWYAMRTINKCRLFSISASIGPRASTKNRTYR